MALRVSTSLRLHDVTMTTPLWLLLLSILQTVQSRCSGSVGSESMAMNAAGQPLPLQLLPGI